MRIYLTNSFVVDFVVVYFDDFFDSFFRVKGHESETPVTVRLSIKHKHRFFDLYRVNFIYKIIYKIL